jgi:magnesium-transporting ATPase (P-type)
MDLNETRSSNSVYTFKDKSGKDQECLIPFSSDIKFNLFIRDMNPKATKQECEQNIDNNLCVFMKGAPERILNRCSKILIEGNEVDFTP